MDSELLKEKDEFSSKIGEDSFKNQEIPKSGKADDREIDEREIEDHEILQENQQDLEEQGASQGFQGDQHLGDYPRGQSLGSRHGEGRLRRQDSVFDDQEEMGRVEEESARGRCGQRGRAPRGARRVRGRVDER